MRDPGSGLKVYERWRYVVWEVRRDTEEAEFMHCAVCLCTCAVRLCKRVAGPLAISYDICLAVCDRAGSVELIIWSASQSEI